MTVDITPRTIYDGRDLSSGYTWNVDLTNSYFYGCNLSGVDLSQVTSFKGCEFYWCNMTGTKFTNLDLRNLNFGAGPTLQWCNLTSADFTGANLSYVNLTGNTLANITISGATTTGTVGLVGVSVVTAPPSTNITPTMTADNAPSPLVVTSSPAAVNSAFWAFDQDNTSAWLAGGTTGSLALDWGSGVTKTITQYKITCGGASGVAPNYELYHPKDWTFDGSANGSTWVTLDTQTGAAAWSYATHEVRTFSIANTTAYRHYRINITLNQGGASFCGLGDLTLMGY